MNAEPYPIARRRRVHRRYRALKLAGLALLLGVVVWAGWYSALLQIESVKVVGNRMVTTQAVLSAANVPAGQSLLRVDSTSVADRLSRIREIESVEVRRVPLHSVVLVITERTPIAAFRSGPAGWQLIDRHGVVFGQLPAKPADMIIVNADATTARAAAAQVAVALPAWLTSEVETVSADSADDVQLHLTNDRLVLWGSGERTERKVLVLRPLLQIPAKVYDVSAPDMPTTRS